MPKCKTHGAELVCLRCIAAKGGRATARRHKAELKKWGKKGGRPKR